MIKVQCVGCKATKELTFEQAAKLSGPPPCDNCPMFCVAISATTKKKGKSHG
jgi:hypothetical protein